MVKGHCTHFILLFILLCVHFVGEASGQSGQEDRKYTPDKISRTDGVITIGSPQKGVLIKLMCDKSSKEQHVIYIRTC